MGGSPATLAESGAACPKTLRSARRTFSFRAPEHPPLVSIPCLCEPSLSNSTLCLEVGLAESFRELHEVQPSAAIPVRPSGSSCHRGSMKYKPRSAEARLEAAFDRLCRLDLNITCLYELVCKTSCSIGESDPTAASSNSSGSITTMSVAACLLHPERGGQRIRLRKYTAIYRSAAWCWIMAGVPHNWSWKVACQEPSVL